MTDYHWGTPDASVSFCEPKYTMVPWVAEYHNTITSLIYAVVGIIFLGTNVDRMAKCLIVVGIGAACLHMTLRKYGQWLDELSMLYLIYCGLRHLRPDRFKMYMLIPLTAGYYVFCGNFLFFLSTFTGMQVVIFVEARRQLPAKYGPWATSYIVTFSTATVCWLLDQTLCSYVVAYQLHAWWHVLTGIAIGQGFVGLALTAAAKESDKSE